MTTEQGLSAEDVVTAWRRRHVKVHDTDTMDDGSLEEWDMCGECEQDWPCDTSMVLERLELAETALRPFARAYWQRVPENDERPIMTVWDDEQREFVLTAGDFHRAAAALAGAASAVGSEGA